MPKSKARIEKYENDNGDIIERTYDSNGNRLTYKDSTGFNLEYAYDEYGNCISGGNIKKMISITYI